MEEEEDDQLPGPEYAAVHEMENPYSIYCNRTGTLQCLSSAPSGQYPDVDAKGLFFFCLSFGSEAQEFEDLERRTGFNTYRFRL